MGLRTRSPVSTVQKSKPTSDCCCLVWLLVGKCNFQVAGLQVQNVFIELHTSVCFLLSTFLPGFCFVLDLSSDLRESRHPAEETHFSCLDPPSQSFSPYPETRTPAKNWNRDSLQSPEVHLQDQLPLNPHNMTHHCWHHSDVSDDHLVTSRSISPQMVNNKSFRNLQFFPSESDLRDCCLNHWQIRSRAALIFYSEIL